VVAEAKEQELVRADIKVIQGLRDGRPNADLTHAADDARMRRFADLRRGQTASRVALWPCRLGIPIWTDASEHFKPAVAATGFTLKRLDEDQPARADR